MARAHTTILASLLAVTTISFAALRQDNVLSPQEAKDGFRLLFDGKTTNGWTGFRKDHVPTGWSAKNGILTVEPGKEHGDLRTVEMFDSFDLRIEWRVPAGANSGIFYRVTEDQNTAWATGPEYQILDNQRHPDGRNPKTSAGSNYAIHGVDQKWTRPAGQWNESRIVARGNQIEHWLNGIKVVSYELGSPEWEKLVKESKFAGLAQYGRRARGYIVLQDHGYVTEFKNIRIKELKSPKTTKMRVLAFSATKGFRHGSIPAALAALKTMAEEKGFDLETTEDSAAFSAENLRHFNTVVFLLTTGDVLNPQQESAFQKYIEDGGGYVGVHSASDTEYDWPWYGKLVGAYFSGHPEIQEAVIRCEDRKHQTTSMLPAEWRRKDEWYNFRQNPRRKVQVLASVDEATFKGGTMKGDHPVVWCQTIGKGRSWYTALGHTDESYKEPLFLDSLYQALLWTANSP